MLSTTQNIEEHREALRQDWSFAVQRFAPVANEEQVLAISRVLGWVKEVEDGIHRGSSSGAHRAMYTYLEAALGLQNEALRLSGCMPFFICGPPGTGKLTLISWLLHVALNSHSFKATDADLLPKHMKRALVVTCTNASLDDIMAKVISQKNFEGPDRIVRVGVRGTNRVTSYCQTVKVAQRTRNTRYLPGIRYQEGSAMSYYPMLWVRRRSCSVQLAL